MNFQSRTVVLSNIKNFITDHWNPSHKRSSRKLKQTSLGSIAGLESLEDRVLLAGTASGVGKRQIHIVLPKARNDNARVRTNAKTAVRGNILRNDNLGNPKAELYTISSRGKKFKMRARRVIQGKYGVLRIQRNGKFTYKLKKSLPVIKNLKKGQRRFENFGYLIKGGCGRSNARLRISILGTKAPVVNKPPLAVDDDYEFEDNTIITPLNVLINDSDPDGDPLSIVSIDLTGTVGNATANPDGTITYVPDLAALSSMEINFFTDTFQYTITDGNGGTSTATVTISFYVFIAQDAS